MKQILIILIGYLFMCPPSLQAQASNLVLSMDQPKVNRKIGFQYTGDLAKGPDCESILYYSVVNRVYAKSLGNALVGDKLLGSFTLPDSAQAFALVFKVQDKLDKNNDLGFVFNIYKDNQPILGTYGSEATFFGNMSGLLGIKKDYDKATSLYEKEFAEYPDQKEYYRDDYLMAALYGQGKQEVLDKLKAKWKDEISRQAPEDSLMQLYGMLTNFDRPEAQSYKEALLKLYPHGLLSAKNAANVIYTLPTGDSMINAYQALIASYPELKPGQIFQEQQFYYIVAKKYLEAGDFNKFQQYADKVTIGNMRSSLYNAAAWPIAESGHKDSLELGIALAKKSVEAADQMKNDRPSYYTQKNWEAICQNNYGMVADTYAYLLFQQGKIKEALDIQQKAVPGLNSDPDMNMRLVKYMLAGGDDGQALAKAADFIKAGKGNPGMDSLLKVAYRNVNNSDTGFIGYLDKLKESAHQVQLETIKANMIDENGHSFSLKDLQGDPVLLDSLRGKVVIVDFWATWCGPCKMSFPGMQLALDKYKEDPDVVFLFIDTWERQPKMEDRIKEVKKVMQDGNYSFRVLLDTPKDAEKNTYNTVDAYGVKGIPTKFVLDKNGHIRFTAVGYDGDSQKLADDLSVMIELAKKG